MDEYKLSPDKMINVCSDNCHAMIRASKNFSEEIKLKINSIADNNYILESEIKNETEEGSEHDFEEMQEVEILNVENKLLFRHSGCLQHIIQLVIIKSIKETTELNILTAKVMKLIVLLRKNKNREVLKTTIRFLLILDGILYLYQLKQ